MKRMTLLVGALCVWQIAPSDAHAQRLIPAHPTAPVAFTFPPVRDYTGRIHVRKAAARVRTQRRIYAHRHTQPRRTASGFYEITDWGYHSLLTGWRPLPYEFGPYSARVVVLR